MTEPATSPTRIVNRKSTRRSKERKRDRTSDSHSLPVAKDQPDGDLATELMTQLGEKRGYIQLLTDAICAKNHFARDRSGRLYIFRDGVYQLDGERQIKQSVKELMNKWNATKQWRSHLADEVVKYIGADPKQLWDRPPLDQINVLNGIIKLDARGKHKLVPHSPEFLSIVQLPIEYDPAAEAIEWERFIKQTFPEDATCVAWEIAAWLMTPDTSIQKAILIIGESANGKSTFLSALTAFIGKRNISNLSLHQLEGNRFAVAGLQGKLANICADLPSTDLKSSTMFKALVGGDRITAERKFADQFEFESFARLVFSANHPPRSADSSQAFYRRWLVLPFLRTFEDHEAMRRNVLDAKLSASRELSGVLNRALAVLPHLQRDGFTQTLSMREAMNEFREVTDPLAAWFQREVIEQSSAVAPIGEMFAAYNDDAQREGRPPYSSEIAFSKAIRRLRPELQEPVFRTIAGARKRCWLGIGLKG